jgi:hypothetical protein
MSEGVESARSREREGRDMRRITIMGMFLAATLALSAMAASSALAGEFITCSKDQRGHRR